MAQNNSLLQNQYFQPISIFEYQPVEGQQVRENWLSDSGNIVEYRKTLFQAFKGAQDRYLQRKREDKVSNQMPSVLEMDEPADFFTVNPKMTSLAVVKRKCVKDSRGSMRRQIERYFVIDNLLITFFKHKNDSDFNKNASLDGAFVLVETVFDENKEKWHLKTKNYRVQIILPTRQMQPIFFYTNNLNKAKTLAARIYISSTQKRSVISDMIRKLSVIEVIFRFRTVWMRIFNVYNSRLLKMISFQIMGINLIELANTGWFQREKLFKFWSAQILKRDKIPLLRSTFRFGQLKRSAGDFSSTYRSSLMIREQLKKLLRAFKNRRLQRHSAIQRDIVEILRDEETGAKCHNAQVQNNELKIQYQEANVKIEHNKYLVIQRLQDNSSVDFYEKNPPLKFGLEHVSAISTDFDDFNKRQDLFTVKLFGRITKEVIDPPSQLANIGTSTVGLDIPRRLNEYLYLIKINSIEIPISFAQKFSLKADVRVKLQQYKDQEAFDRGHYFYINSRPYRISLSPSQTKGRMVIKGQDYQFTVDPLDVANKEEKFRLCVVMQRNNVPVTQFMKEFLYEEEFTGKKEFKYTEEGKDLDLKVSDQQGNKMKIKFSVERIRNEGGSMHPQEREGQRLLIGRYCLNQKQVYVVQTLDRNMNVTIKNIQTGEVKENVPIKRIKLIERSGINVYNLNQQPHSVSNSSYAWTIEFQTRNRRLINMITSSIQNRQVYNSFGQRSFNRDKKRDIEGKILISVIEAMNIKSSKICSTYVKITSIPQAQSGNQVLMKEYMTSVVKNSNEPSWVDEDNPAGYLVDLGVFFKEEKHDFKFELLNKSSNQNEQDSVLGQLTLSSDDFIDTLIPGKEKCLILENPNKEFDYIFLVIQSLFVSTNVTRIEYQLVNDLSIYKSPEQYFHYLYLQKQFITDEFGYAVPLSKYFPNYLEKLTQMDSNQNQVASKALLTISKSPLLFDVHQTPDKTCSPAIAYIRQMLCSTEERLSFMLRGQNLMRPEIEEGVLIFKYLWKYRVFSARQEAYLELQKRFWIRFMLERLIYAKMNPFILEIKDADNIINETISDYDRQSLNGQNNLLGWIKQKATGQESQENQRQTLQTVKFNLMFNKIWDNETNQGYADTFYLVQSGIPTSQRVKIWNDLLKVKVLEYEELQFLKSTQYFNEEKSVYQMYKEAAGRQDCLAFRQIDEDVENFKFPKMYQEEIQHNQKVVDFKQQKRKMRTILRVQVLWSRERKQDSQVISYSYTKGMLKILQRLVIMASEEEAFWLLNGMIRQIPRLFSTDVSCLVGGRISAMRNEMTAFKAILKENLPLICDKLRLLGLPVDQLIYDSMTSFYAYFFSSDVVLRIWDLIIFNISNTDKIAKKRALWHFMAPAYLILREKRDDIMNANSIQQVIDIYNNGSSLTYNPDWVVQEMKTLIKDIFVTGAERFQNQQGKLSLNLDRFVRNSKVDKAQLMEEQRKNYEADLSVIFNSIEEENKEIAKLLENTDFKGSPQQPQYLDYIRWRTHVMAKFKKVALKNSSDVVDALYEYDEPELHREDLDLTKINVYIHSITNLTGIKSFKMKLFYGKLAPDLSFQSIEDRFNDEVYSTFNINQYHAFEYLKGFNHIKIEIYDNLNEDNVVCEQIMDLGELNPNRFIKKYYQLKNDYLVENLESYRYPFTVAMISFFLQSHTSQQLDAIMQQRNSEMSQFINSIKRKLPDRIDIFNKKNEKEFVEAMRGDFKRIIKEEFQALRCFLPESQARKTINDNFNYIEDSDFGNISVENLKFLIKSCFFSDWLPHMDSLYKIFVKEQDEDQKKEEESPREIPREVETSRISFNVLSKLRNLAATPIAQNNPQEEQKNSSMRKSHRNFELEDQKQSSKLPFSLRNFIVSLVLMSHCTVNEKFDILYDLFDWNDGTADGLDMNAIFLLIKTIFERNLYYWPSHELFNLVEMAFDMSVSSVYQVFWTKDPNVQVNKRSVKLTSLLSNHALISTEAGVSVDVTDEVLETLNSYQRMFGTKIIDFNQDSSAFKNLDVLVKGGKQLLDITRSKGKYRLVIFYQVSSERYMFEVEYDSQGQLKKNRELAEKDDIDEYLKRNINKLYLVGRSKGVTKHEFLAQTSQIPFLQDLVRVETLYRDRLQSTLQKKRKLSKELTVLMNHEETMLVFRFQSKVMANVEGDIQRIDKNTFRVLMTEVFEQDVVADVRERIIRVIQKIGESNHKLSEVVREESVLEGVKGVKEFFCREDNSNKWRQCNEFDRLVSLQGDQGDQQSSEIILKLEQTKHISEESYFLDKEEERDLAAFDCYSLYKHCDLSYEWRLCKIMQKEPVLQPQLDLAGSQPINIADSKGGVQQFYYWIEYLHHRKMGQKIWLKRRREEVLMSARYAREQQRNYEQETLKFIKETYQEQQPRRETVFKSVKKNLNEEFFDQRQ